MARAGALWTHVLSKPLVDVVRRRKHSSRAPASLPHRRANAWHQHTWTWQIALAGKNHELSRPTFSPARTGRSLFVGYFAAFRADPRARACRPARERPPASARPRSDRLRHLWSARESRPARSHEPEVRPPTATLANSPQPLPSQRGSSKSDARPAAPGGCWRRTRARAPAPRRLARSRSSRSRTRAFRPNRRAFRTTRGLESPKIRRCAFRAKLSTNCRLFFSSERRRALDRD